MQACLNHGGSNSIQGGNRKFLGCTHWLSDPQSSWKYVENMYNMNIQLRPLSLNPFFLTVTHPLFKTMLFHIPRMRQIGYVTFVLLVECLQFSFQWSYQDQGNTNCQIFTKMGKCCGHDFLCRWKQFCIISYGPKIVTSQFQLHKLWNYNFHSMWFQLQWMISIQ